MSEIQSDKESRFVSLRIKLLVGFIAAFVVFTLLSVLVFGGAFYWFYSFATDMAMQRIQEDMVDTLNGAIAGIDGDEFLALATEAEPREDGRTDDPRYWEHQEWLEMVHNVEPRAHPYTYIKGEGERELHFVGDILWVTDPGSAAAFLESYESKSGAMLDSLEALTLKMEPYEDDWGHWVSAYAPITNAAGEKVGAMGMDFRADYVFQVQESIRSVVGVAFGITIGVLLILIVALLFLVFGVSNNITRPVIALTAIAERVAEGDYEQDMSALYGGRTRDEVGTLAHVFQMMVDKVHARERRLKQEVEQLKIEIDEAKKERQVAQIIESDYFQELRKKAQDLRGEGEEQ